MAHNPEIIHINRVGTNVYDPINRSLRVTTHSESAIDTFFDVTRTDDRLTETWNFYSDQAKTVRTRTFIIRYDIEGNVVGGEIDVAEAI